MSILDGMSSFVTVVDKGSFTKAAEELGQTKSALSKHVSKLEERLGVKLLNRTTRKLSLTDAGQNYYEKASTIIEQAEEAEAEITSFQVAPRGKLRITMPLSFGNMEIKNILPGFLETYPELEMEVFLSDQVVDLMESNFDMAIRVGKLRDSSLIARKLGVVKSVIVASPDYWKKHGKPTHPRELVDHECMRYSNAPNPNQWVFNCPDGHTETVQLEGRFISNNGEMEVHLATAGLGVCRVPRFICEKQLQDGSLEPALDKYELDEIGIYAVYMPGRHVPTKIRAFIDYLLEHLNV